MPSESEQSKGAFPVGIYTVSQAAVLAEIPNTAKVRRWLFGSAAGDSAVIPTYIQQSEHASFIDLMQIMAICAIRSDERASLQKIRQTVDVAAQHGINYPFARRHQTFVFDDDLVIKLADGALMQVTGKYKSYQLIHAVAYTYMQDVGFDLEGLADSYTPERLNGRSVVLSSRRRLGAPVVLPCNFTVESLVNAVRSEGSDANAARVMGVDLLDIKIALRYEDRLSRAIAA